MEIGVLYDLRQAVSGGYGILGTNRQLFPYVGDQGPSNKI